MSLNINYNIIALTIWTLKHYYYNRINTGVKRFIIKERLNYFKCDLQIQIKKLFGQRFVYWTFMYF